MTKSTQWRVIQTPFGRFDSCKEAAVALELPNATVSGLLKSKLFPEWFHVYRDFAPLETMPNRRIRKYEVIDIRKKK